jgi:hypothetical protein
VRRALDNAPGRADGVVLREADGAGHVVGRPHGDIADGRRVRDLHQTPDHLAEGAVSADAGNRVKFGGIGPRKFRCVLRAAGKEQLGPKAAVGQGFHRLTEIIAVAAAAGGGIDDQHQLFHAFPSPSKSPRDADTAPL